MLMSFFFFFFQTGTSGRRSERASVSSNAFAILRVLPVLVRGWGKGEGHAAIMRRIDRGR